jgi:hypothetical protein
MTCLIKATVLALLLPAMVLADSWKDESGKGRKGWDDDDRRGWYDETPDWARGRGYWDGYYLLPRPDLRWQSYYPPPVIEYRYGPPRYGLSWEELKEREKRLRKREKELEKREREIYKEWRKRTWDD